MDNQESKNVVRIGGSELNAGLERKLFDAWACDGRKLGSMELLFAWEAWKESARVEREACAKIAETAAHKLGGWQFAADAIRQRSNVN